MLTTKVITAVCRPILTRYVRGSKSIIVRGFITVNFYTAKGEKKTVRAEPGESILRIAQHNGIPLEGDDSFFLLF